MKYKEGDKVIIKSWNAMLAMEEAELNSIGNIEATGSTCFSEEMRYLCGTTVTLTSYGASDYSVGDWVLVDWMIEGLAVEVPAGIEDSMDQYKDAMQGNYHDVSPSSSSSEATSGKCTGAIKALQTVSIDVTNSDSIDIQDVIMVLIDDGFDLEMETVGEICRLTATKERE